MLPVSPFDDERFIFMATSNGTVKKTSIVNFARQRSVGLKAIELDEGDELIGTAITDGSRDVMLVSNSGKTIRFKESDVRAMGRAARGVRGIRMSKEFKMISLIIPSSEKQILTVSENGYGKKTSHTDYRVTNRGGKGIIGIINSPRNGNITSSFPVFEGDEILISTNKGRVIRVAVKEIRTAGRNTQGVRIIKLSGEEKVVSAIKIDDNLI